MQGIIDEAALVSSGLTDNQKDTLKLKGITFIIVGSVSRYNCEQSSMVVPTTIGYVKGSKNLCHVSLSLKALDVKTGDILWAVQCSNSEKGKQTTAAKILNNMLPEIVKQIP